MENKKVNKRILEGVVVSDKMEKTVVVLVSEYKKHKIYKKYYKVSKKYKAHDKDNSFKIGDNVRILESKPISKDKKWVVLK